MNTKLSKKIGRGIMTLLIAASFIPAVAGACPGRGQRGQGCDLRGQKGPSRSMLHIWQNPQMVQDLGLSPDQVTKLKQADFSAQEKRLDLRTEMSKLKLEMNQAFAADVVDNKVVRELAGKIAAVKGKMSVKKVEARLAMRNLLTPDQVKKMKMIRQSRRQGRNTPCNLNGNRPCNQNRGRN
ncbi:MAG: periplasmic heavy metal sensor [Candidatus Electrothrix sp. AR3]|nr:periplasmic heavy metal sensor [Candidatus Electrothrix sp. AR3]